MTFAASYKDLERASRHSGVDLSNPKARALASEEETWEGDFLFKAFTEISDKNMLALNDSDLTYLKEVYTTFPKITQKNPYGFILGYLATSRGRDYRSLSHILSQYKQLNISGIEDPDVVRYARYWRLYGPDRTDDINEL